MRWKSTFRRGVIAAAISSLVAVAQAQVPCDPGSQQYKDCVRLVDSLRPDKAGQARVFAADGSEFTAGQALWMRGQLRKVARLCASDRPEDHEEATRTLMEVRELLQSHHRDS
jgi:hypothetical protein